METGRDHHEHNTDQKLEERLRRLDRGRHLDGLGDLQTLGQPAVVLHSEENIGGAAGEDLLCSGRPTTATNRYWIVPGASGSSRRSSSRLVLDLRSRVAAGSPTALLRCDQTSHEVDALATARCDRGRTAPVVPPHVRGVTAPLPLRAFGAVGLTERMHVEEGLPIEFEKQGSLIYESNPFRPAPVFWVAFGGCGVVVFPAASCGSAVWGGRDRAARVTGGLDPGGWGAPEPTPRWVTSRGRADEESRLGQRTTRLARMPGCDRTLRVRGEISTVGSMLAFGDALMTVRFTEQRILQTASSGCWPVSRFPC